MKGISVNRSEQTKNHFPIVAIGASAGGIEAVIELLKNLPDNTGMSFIYIQHLDPKFDSKLDEILGRATKMPVLEAREKMRIKPDHLYLIPPNREMTMLDGSLRLSLRPARPSTHLPINNFFNSLAENYKETSIGILLSGNGSDGTLGLKAIKTAGGITFAQDSSAKFGAMPKNAVSEEAVDLVLSPKRMAEELTKLASQQGVYYSMLHKLEEEQISDFDEKLQTILKLVHRLTGVDFSHYKISTIKRRIVRRMILHKQETLAQYSEYLKHHTTEIQQLYADLLINVTSFFRDEDSFDYIKKMVLPKIIKAKSPSEPLRIWVPACSTGQEAYSLAILLMEVLGEKAATTTVQIFATDLSEVAINKARLGIYTKDELADVSPRRLQRFFTKIDGSSRIIKGIRDICIFATHNILKDPPFSRLDLVSCCNLMIYLETNLQKKLLNTFHYSLNNNGYLHLGKSETIGTSTSLFSQVEKKFKVYAKKKDSAAKAMFEMSFRSPEMVPVEKSNVRTPTANLKSEEVDIDKAVEQVLLKKYTPACVVVNQDLDIIQFRGSTGLFLEPAPGKASLNLLKMARPGLGFELRTVVHKAGKAGVAEQKSWIETAQDNRSRKISIEAVPIKTDETDNYFLVVFDEEYVPIQEASAGSVARDKRVKQLEAELSALREDMRSIVEAQEAANEELQSVNEEIVSSNEELQSINEELETSKEELESSNEELITINQELQMRNEQLAEIQDYSEAMFTTIRESLLILDKNLRIKNANSCFYKTFEVTEEETEGKLLYDVGNKQWNIPKLKELLEEVIPRNSQVQDFEVVHTFQHIGEKIMLVNARRLIRRVLGEHLILLAIEDITHYRQAQRIIEQKEEWFESMANNSPMMIWVTGVDKKLEFVNSSWLQHRSMKLEEAIGETWMEDGMHPDDKAPCERVFNESFEGKKDFTVQYRLKGTDGMYRNVLSKGSPNYSHDGTFTGYIGSCVEMPDKVLSN